MPRRDDLESILLIGSGPIVIGQACEFDYSGTQACRVLREEGYRVVLANSNPATIMTDPDFADATYVEPLRADVIARRPSSSGEQPDALLPTLGGPDGPQPGHASWSTPGCSTLTGSNSSAPTAEAIATAEDRGAVQGGHGRDWPERCRLRHRPHMEEALEVVRTIGLPAVIRPAYILGGRGTGYRHHRPGVRTDGDGSGLEASPDLRDPHRDGRSPAGRSSSWRSCETVADNCVVICSIENVDPMGSTPATRSPWPPPRPLPTWSIRTMRDASFACLRRVGVETGGSNVQFAVHPETGKQVIIEMNPRVSRSSALASKATGFPIAKIAAKLAVGYTLDEIPNDITRKTPASFEPTIDYVVTKIPRWAFEKFPGTSGRAVHLDAVGGRGNGDRPDLPRIPAEGHALAGERAPGPQRRPDRGGTGRPQRRRPAGRRGGPHPPRHACFRWRRCSAAGSTAGEGARGH